MPERLCQVFISDVRRGDRVHTDEGTLLVGSIEVAGLPDEPEQWVAISGTDERGQERLWWFEASEVVWCLRQEEP